MKKSTAIAEISWCLQAVITHRSFRDAETDCTLMKANFPDEKIAENMKLKKDKISYGVTFGLGLYFRSELNEKIKNYYFCVVGCDESLNKYSQSQQMNITVRYRDSQESEVKTRGIHTLHDSFKTGITATNWNLSDLFRALYNFFNDVPIHRGDFIRITNCLQFPLKFCNIRWIQNAPVAQRTSGILESIQNFFDSFKNQPKNHHLKYNNFEIARKLVKDNLLPARLAFFEMFARDIEPFLDEFQSDKPLTRFLHTALYQIVHTTMTRIVKKEVLDSTPIKDIDMNDNKNLKINNDVDVGFGARKCLKSKFVAERYSSISARL
ncbi:uncharacterized protein LOC117177794 [Belonocnema kinseyi]|uniref:uncharacterized protein LOC117177794 n=1 Tax=Belonocnema kinseyi TaxID=2817044 RepID=UPI00143DD8B8|nr:uncharacterized protein LOC117177794 [Belonocnema kinseyi]